MLIAVIFFLFVLLVLLCVWVTSASFVFSLQSFGHACSSLHSEVLVSVFCLGMVWWTWNISACLYNEKLLFLLQLWLGSADWIHGHLEHGMHCFQNSHWEISCYSDGFSFVCVLSIFSPTFLCSVYLTMLAVGSFFSGLVYLVFRVLLVSE